MSGYIDHTDDALNAAMIAHASDIEEMAIARAKELRKSALRQLWYKRRDALADSELDELRTHLAKLRGASQEELASEFGVVSTAELKRAIYRVAHEIRLAETFDKLSAGLVEKGILRAADVERVRAMRSKLQAFDDIYEHRGPL